MSNANSIFSSFSSEKRWVTEMCKAFPQEQAVDIDLDTPPCVFRVPKSLSETKPETYTPQKIGLGPYHHLRPDLYPMQRKKLAAVDKFLKAKQLPSLQLVVEELLQLEYLIRASYSEYLDLDPVTLAWIIAIDAVYLLQLLEAHTLETGKDSDLKILAGDILMLENQIPTKLILEVLRILKLSSDDVEALHIFCGQESPLEFNQANIDISYLIGHPLMATYHLIVTNRGIRPQELRIFNESAVFVNIKQGVEVASSLGLPGGDIIQKHIDFIEKVPWDKILALFRTGDPDEQNPLVEEISIPSVAQLAEIAGIAFELTPGGIRDVKFNEEEKKFYLPAITLKSSSEVILRNLVAYEAASAKPGSSLELAEYVDLMCGIVDTPKDVEILRNAKIIKGDLSDGEIARVFNGIRKSTGDKDKKRTNIEKAIDRVNQQYDNTAKVKMLRLIKRHVYRSWKFLTVFSTVMVLVLLALQAFCEIYGCNKRLFKS